MKDGFSNVQIIRKCDKEYDLTSRLANIVPSDLRYLRKKYNLAEGRLDENDFISLQKRVDRNWPEDGIRFFSPPRDDGAGFLMVVMTPDQKELCERYGNDGICIDDTHNPSKYNLKLTTMLVVNGHGRGIPVAYMISSTVTQEDVKQLFECIVKEIPDFHPQYFMSDEAHAFWNGYNCVLKNHKTQRLWCIWHVQRALFENADKLLPKCEAETVKGTLTSMMGEPTKAKYENLLATLLEHLENDCENGKQYADYFRRSHLDYDKLWAGCFRRGAPFQTSMFSESWHAALKKEHLQLHTNIRIDALLKVLYDAFEWVVRKLAKQSGRCLKTASARKAQNLRNCAKAKLQAEDYILSQNEKGDFEIEAKASGKVYTVEDLLGCSCAKDENCHCSCGACWTRFLCTCPGQKSGVSCKHVHMAIASGHLLENETNTPATDRDDMDMEPFQNIPLPAPHQPFNAPSTMGFTYEAEKLYNEFMQENDVLCRKMRQYKKSSSAESLETMRKNLEIVREANKNTPGTSQVLTVRRDAHLPYRTATQTMNRIVRRKKGDRKRSNKLLASSLPPKKDVSICSKCHFADPVLDSDIHETDFESIVTEWLRCSTCKLPVHFVCSHDGCPSCGGTLESYLPDEVDTQNSSSEDDDQEEGDEENLTIRLVSSRAG